MRPCYPRVTGAELNGSRDATFILHGCFTGDGSANAAAIVNGRHGWGELRDVTSRRLASTGATGPHPGSIIRWDIEFDHGRLATIDSGGYFGVAGSNLFPRVRVWAWQHDGLQVTADSGFTAHATAAPTANATALPLHGCPLDGTYRASFGVRYSFNRTYQPNTPLVLEVFPVGDHYPNTAACTQIVLSSLPVTIRAGHSNKPLSDLYPGPLTNRRWITAPAWLLVCGSQGLGVPTPLFKDETGLDSPYHVPQTLGVNEIITHFHRLPRH